MNRKKVTSIIDVQVSLENPKLTRLLIWEQQGNTIVAKPKRRLPETVFREILRKFREMGVATPATWDSQWNWKRGDRDYEEKENNCLFPMWWNNIPTEH